MAIKKWCSYRIPLLLFALCIVGISCTREDSDVPLSSGTPPHIARQIKVCINQFVYHPNLDLLLKGFKNELSRWAGTQKIKVTYDLKNAAGEISVATQIARQQAAEGPDLILALATPSAQASMRATSSIPILFGAITDPVTAGLARSLDRPGGNATGSSDLGPYTEQFKMIRRLLPSATQAGVIRNPGEANSIASMTLIDEAMRLTGFTKSEVSVSNTNEVLAAAKALVDRCDFFYLPADNTVLSALPAVYGVAKARKIPLFVGDEGSVKLGGVATIGVDYFELGKLTGKQAIQILEGVEPGTIPVARQTATKTVINLKAAKDQGVTLPKSLLETAEVVDVDSSH